MFVDKVVFYVFILKFILYFSGFMKLFIGLLFCVVSVCFTIINPFSTAHWSLYNLMSIHQQHYPATQHSAHSIKTNP